MPGFWRSFLPCTSDPPEETVPGRCSPLRTNSPEEVCLESLDPCNNHKMSTMDSCCHVGDAEEDSFAPPPPAPMLLGASSIVDIRQEGSFDSKKAVHVWFVRHGESANNVLMDRICGPSRISSEEKLRRFKAARQPDPPLSRLGKQQVDNLPVHSALEPLLSDPAYGINLYVSPLRRALETARPIQETLVKMRGCPAPMHVLPFLTEVGGLYTTTSHGVDLGKPGMSPAEFKKLFPDLDLDLSKVPEHGWWHKSDGGEDAEGLDCEFWDRAKRVSTWLRSLQPEIQNGRLVRHAIVVGHGALFDRVLCELLGLGRSHVLINHVNAGVTHLELSGPLTRIYCINSIPKKETLDEGNHTTISM
mmetsp:Transcript_31176/g.60157  ORF Transcript_31176/g.60157 Transcript_31176/m.60157 type:complete len:361 (+) Transcript_31176:187-1269(+)